MLLNIKKNIFLYHLSLILLAPFSWQKRVALLEFHKRYQKIINQCQKRLQKDKKNAPYLYEIIARNLRNLNKIDESIDYINKAKSFNYDNGSITYEQGLIYFIQKNYQKARQSLEDAVNNGYDTAPLQIHLGKTYYQLGLLDKAERCFRRVLKVYPKEGSIYFLLGIVLKNKMLYEEAEKAFLKAIKCGSDQKEEHLGLAEIYTRKGEWKKAMREYKQILEIEPECFVAHYFLGIIYDILGRDSAAIKELIIANKINPDDEDTRKKLTKLLASTPQ